LALVMAGLTGLGGLALVMGTALSSVAELLALLLRTDGWVGSCGSPLGTDVRPSGIRRPYDRALFRAVAAWQDENGGFTHRSDGREMRAEAR
jgi:hypothetical protein